MASLLINLKQLFPTVLRMSISAGILTLAVVLLRLMLRKAPKWARCLLWALVALRLLCPVLPEMQLSPMPRSEVYDASRQLIERAADGGAFPLMEFERSQPPADGAGPAVRHFSVALPGAYLLAVWPLGILGMLLYALLSYLRLRRRTAASAPFREGVFLCDGIGSPFILGVFRPRVYIPSRLEKQQISFVLAHERAHLRRRDHWWKPLGFLLLAVHWFNPLLWLAYVLLCRDIELACDERAVKDMAASDRADYAQALLDCSFPRRTVGFCPLAFGEVGVKRRVKNVLDYRKPAFWIAAGAVAVCLLAALFFLTDPPVLLPENGGIAEAEYASVGENIPLPPEAWEELAGLIEAHRGRRFPAGTDALGTLSRSVTLHYADGSYVLVHHQYVSGFDFLRGREDDYRTVVTWFDDRGKARKAWRMGSAFDDAFTEWKSRWISRQENALDWMWKHYEVESLLYTGYMDDPRTDVRSCALGEDYALWVSAGEDGQWQRIGRLEPFTPEKSSFDGKYGYYAACDSAAALRKQNRLAWRAVTEDAPDARFYDLFYQKNGDILLGAGWYDAGEAGDPYSDDSRVYRLYRLAGTLEEPSEEALNLDALRERYPEYFGLSAFKGLELYVWQLGPGVLRCGLMEGTNRNKTSEEIWSLRGVTVEEMKRILSTYDVPADNIFLYPFLHPASSYIYNIDEEYRAWLRELFFGSAAIAAPQPDEPGILEAPLLTVTSGGTTVVPYLHLRFETTWLEEEHGFLAGDGWPLEWDIQEYGDKIPILILNGELTLTLGENVSCGRPIRVYDGDLTLLVQQEDEDSLDALYRLAPGDYWCSLGVYRRGRYIPEAERYEEAGYDGVFRLWVPETGDEGE